MKSSPYDVIVAGCGPAGSSAAYAASKAGAKVAVFEREEQVATTVRTSGVTWLKDAISMGIPPSLYNPVKRYAFCSKNNEVIIEGEKPGAAVLDVRGTYRWLAERARNAGAEIMTGTAVTGASPLVNGSMSIQTCSMDGHSSHSCSMAIDASGFSSVLASKLGGVKKWEKFGVGAEYEAHAEHVDADTWWLMVGSEYTPSGYAWIFPVSPDTVRIGVGVGKPDWSENPTVLLDKIIKEKTGPIASLGKISPFEFHSGIIPNDGTVRRTVHDGLLMVGDSAGQANPLVLEGIRYAIRYGRMLERLLQRLPYLGSGRKTWYIFSEEMYVDIYNSDGKVVLSVAIKDSPSGYVDETVSINLEQGLYVARIHYHTLTASDFFNTY